MKTQRTNTRPHLDRLTTLADYASEIPEQLNDLLLPVTKADLDQFAETNQQAATQTGRTGIRDGDYRKYTNCLFVLTQPSRKP